MIGLDDVWINANARDSSFSFLHHLVAARHDVWHPAERSPIASNHEVLVELLAGQRNSEPDINAGGIPSRLNGFGPGVGICNGVPGRSVDPFEIAPEAYAARHA